MRSVIKSVRYGPPSREKPADLKLGKTALINSGTRFIIGFLFYLIRLCSGTLGCGV
jgi:hypothetical protein